MSPRRVAALLAFLALVGCGAPGEEGTPDAGPITPALEAGTWNEFAPGGDTACAYGDPFSFFVYPGKVNRVVIDFLGGGGCWDDFTCTLTLPPPENRLYNVSVDEFRNRTPEGIYDKTRTDSPVADWYHVLIPYCTADIHWGDKVETYTDLFGTPLTVRHKGAVNARAVLDWVFRSFSRPDAILVTGCSAGAYGSILWAPYVQQHYRDVPVFQLGDSGAGVVTPDFFGRAFSHWNALPAAPTFIPELDPGQVDWSALSLADVYRRVGQHFPGMRLSQFNREHDKTQVGFYMVMKGSLADLTQEWSTGMRASLAAIAQGTPNFASYLAPGDEHCALPYDSFYTQESGGVRLVDYVDDLVNGRPLPEVRCTGCDGGT
ncbi:MAG: pectinacetylesterase family protein [Myxococcaceae bacterium]|nr:pectinacetylesterase family protein [Myxococcaceae bacterium]